MEPWKEQQIKEVKKAKIIGKIKNALTIAASILAFIGLIYALRAMIYFDIRRTLENYTQNPPNRYCWNSFVIDKQYLNASIFGFLIPNEVDTLKLR